MTVQVSNIISKQIEDSQTTQFTSDKKITVIDKFTVTNTSAGVVTISVNLIKKGGAAGNDNLIIKNKSITVDEVFTFPALVNQVLNDGDFISTIASATTSLTLRVSARIVT